MQRTNIVYVCSPDWSDQLLVSIYSLLRSGTTFDKIIVYCIGSAPQSWAFEDPRIEIHEQEFRPEAAILVEGRFYVNKVYLCRSESERTIFLDADTIVNKPIDLIWSRSDADVMARVAIRALEPTWSTPFWNDVQRRVGGPGGYPYFNCGCVVFQNGAHRNLEKAWMELICSLRRGNPVFPGSLHGDGTRCTEQLALSLAIGVHRLSCSLMSPTDHSYLWCGEEYDKSIVFHTSGQRFMGFIGTIGLSVDMASDALLKKA